MTSTSKPVKIIVRYVNTPIKITECYHGKCIYIPEPQSLI